MRRRQFLASGTALLSVAIAGCIHPPVVLDMDAATADDIASEVSMRADAGSEEHVVVSSALENGTATRRGRRELFDRQDTVRFEGTFYEVSERRVGSSEVTVYEVRIDLDPTDSTPEVGQIEYDDLPEADRQRLEPIVSQDDPPEQDGYDLGVEYGTVEELEGESVLVPERQYDIVVYDGTRYRVAVESRTADEGEYRYEVTEIAPDVERFANQVREQYLFTLSALSENERAVVEEAIEGGYFEDDEAFQSVSERIREHPGIREDDFYGTWLLRYEGTEYLTYVEW